jgi:hypothetical protein
VDDPVAIQNLEAKLQADEPRLKEINEKFTEMV